MTFGYPTILDLYTLITQPLRHLMYLNIRIPQKSNRTLLISLDELEAIALNN